MQTQPSRFPLFLKILILWEVVDLFYLIKPPLMRAPSLLGGRRPLGIVNPFAYTWEVVDLFQINTIHPSRRS